MRFVIFLGLVSFFAGGCAHPSDEERIRSAIEAMKSAAEARQPAGVLAEVADDFTGNGGELDRDALGRFLKIQFLRNETVGVGLGPITVDVDGNRATAKFDVTLSDGSRRWLPAGRETRSAVTGWRREGSRWLCYNATWAESSR